MESMSLAQKPDAGFSSGQAKSLCLPLGVALGILGDRLLWPGLNGLGFAVWIGLLGASAAFLAWREALPWRREIALWSVLAFLAALAMALRASEFLRLTMLLVLLVCASMVVMRAWDAGIGRSRVGDHLWAMLMVPARALAGVFPLLSSTRLPAASARRRLGALARGLLLAAPLLLLFTALFSSADATFGRYAGRLADILDADLPLHLALALLFGWLAAGLLSAVPATGWRRPLEELTLPKVGRDETLVVMVSLSVLFTGFVLLQLGYLFGGRELIESISGLTVAEHARRGFFELLAAAALTLAVLIAGDGMSEDRRSFRPLAALLIGCVLVMLASALQRLGLYIAAYGLTLDRVNALAVMAWLAATLILFAATVLRERPQGFASGAALAGILIAFALALANPAALTAKVNLSRAIGQGESLDLAYLVSLGPDAMPVVMRRLDELPGVPSPLSPGTAEQSLAGRCETLAPLLTLAGARPRGLDDWRTWNAAEASAWKAVEERREYLREIAQGCGVQ